MREEGVIAYFGIFLEEVARWDRVSLSREAAKGSWGKLYR